MFIVLLFLILMRRVSIFVFGDLLLCYVNVKLFRYISYVCFYYVCLYYIVFLVLIFLIVFFFSVSLF